MTTEIDKLYNTLRSLNDFGPQGLFLSSSLVLLFNACNLLSINIETYDFVTYGCSSPIFLFVSKVEYLVTESTSAIVSDASRGRKYTCESSLATVDVTSYRHSDCRGSGRHIHLLRKNAA